MVVDSVVTNTSVDFKALCFVIAAEKMMAEKLGTQAFLLLCASTSVS